MTRQQSEQDVRAEEMGQDHAIARARNGGAKGGDD